MHRQSIFIISLAALILSLSGCGGGGGSSSQPLTAGPVTALYSSNGASWNSYVANDGSDRFNASGVACDSATASPGYYACIHGGEMRAVVELVGIVEDTQAGRRSGFHNIEELWEVLSGASQTDRTDQRRKGG